MTLNEVKALAKANKFLIPLQGFSLQNNKFMS